jgi:hypothetical protein
MGYLFYTGTNLNPFQTFKDKKKKKKKGALSFFKSLAFFFFGNRQSKAFTANLLNADRL